jgi:hypothetical protein
LMSRRAIRPDGAESIEVSGTPGVVVGPGPGSGFGVGVGIGAGLDPVDSGGFPGSFLPPGLEASLAFAMQCWRALRRFLNFALHFVICSVRWEAEFPTGWCRGDACALWVMVIIATTPTKTIRQADMTRAIWRVMAEGVGLEKSLRVPLHAATGSQALSDYFPTIWKTKTLSRRDRTSLNLGYQKGSIHRWLSILSSAPDSKFLGRSRLTR